MPSYFRQVPDFDYVSRDPNQRQISEYAPVKNLFRRGKLREDIFGNLSYFTKYKIIGDERPDNVAFKIYNDETLDWVVLLSNNILNIQTEWPLPQVIFDKVMLEKYGSYDELYNGIHHYETNEVRDSSGNLILPSGIQMPAQWKSGNGFVEGVVFAGNVNYIIFDEEFKLVNIALENFDVNVKSGSTVNISGSSDSNFNGTFIVKDTSSGTSGLTGKSIFTFRIDATNFTSEEGVIEITGNERFEFISNHPLTNSDTYYYRYYDSNLENEVTLPSSSILNPITNYEYEIKLEEDKRNIFVLKPQYLNVVFNDMEEIMKYKKGSTQYVSRTLKKGDNIRLYS
jgi:hypothetical protein